jgi:hypothetical protein
METRDVVPPLAHVEILCNMPSHDEDASREALGSVHIVPCPCRNSSIVAFSNFLALVNA